MDTQPTSISFDFAFIGMGCGNSLLLHTLHQAGELTNKKILVFEPDAKNTNDRTFCFWLNPETLRESQLNQLVCKQWNKVRINQMESQTLRETNYFAIRSIDLYKHAKNILEIHGATIVREPFTNVSKRKGHSCLLEMQSGVDSFQAKWVFDSRPPQYKSSKTPHHFLLQSFYGWEIETDGPPFDEGTFTMMDFNVPQLDNTQFMYALPYDKNKALFEITRFGTEAINSDEAQEILEHHLAQFPFTYVIRRKEEGIIPMSNEAIDEVKPVDHWLYTGERGGQLKPSTGYSFARSLAHAKEIANSIIAERPISTNKTKRFAYYDGLLLSILREQPQKGARLFGQLFSRNKIEHVLAFLDEKTSLANELKIFASLPLLPFLKAAGKHAFHQLVNNHLNGLLTIGFTLSLLLLQSFGILYFSIPIFILGLLAVGIPHGALDHLSVLPSFRSRKIVRFIAGYLLLGTAIFLFFQVNPLLGLALFLCYSAWHFGQADFTAWEIKNVPLQGLWGIYLLVGILWSHGSETAEILSQMNINSFISGQDNHALGWWWILGGGILWILMYRSIAMIVSILFLVLSSFLPLLYAFGIFFICQHSMNGWKFLRAELNLSNQQLWKKALPFTLGSIGLFAVIAVFFSKMDWGSIFIFTAALSFPHVWFMHRMYLLSDYK